MFAEGYFSIRFPELLGFVITIVSVWLVVKQLNATRLASQMEGMIALQVMAIGMEERMKAIRDFTQLDEWEKLDDKEAYALISGTDKYLEGYRSYAKLYELMGGLVRAGALDIRVAYEHFGWEAPALYKRFEKFTRGLRKDLGETLNENWEWLALEFEKMNN